MKTEMKETMMSQAQAAAKDTEEPVRMVVLPNGFTVSYSEYLKDIDGYLGRC